MKELKIYAFQAKNIETALRLAIRALESNKKETCMDRDLVQAYEYIKNILAEQPDKEVKRF